MGKKILFCGGGNMAEGIIRSLIKKDVVESEDISVSELNPARCDYLKETYGVQAVSYTHLDVYKRQEGSSRHKIGHIIYCTFYRFVHGFYQFSILLLF